MLKKLVSFTLALVLIMGCLSVTAFADSNIIDEIEPNDTDETMQLIEPNVTVKGTLPASRWLAADPYMDFDAFKFVLNERSKVVLTLTSSSQIVIPHIVNINDPDRRYVPKIEDFFSYPDAFSSYSDEEYSPESSNFSNKPYESYSPEFDWDFDNLLEEYVIDVYLEKGTYAMVLFDMFAEEEVTYEFTLTAKSAVQTLKKEDGVWKYYVGGEFAVETTLFKYNGKWFYVEDGIWSSGVTKLVKHSDKWFYVKNGKWDAKTNTLIKYNGKWFYIKNGKWDTSAKTLFKFKGKWFYIKNGKWTKDTTIVKYSGKKFYVKGGFAQLNFTGKRKIDGQTYCIKNGKVV